MLEAVKVRDRWKKLENWRDLLVEFRDCFRGVSLGEEDVVSIDESPFRGTLAHLQGLAESHSNQKFTNVVRIFAAQLFTGPFYTKGRMDTTHTILQSCLKSFQASSTKKHSPRFIKNIDLKLVKR